MLAAGAWLRQSKFCNIGLTLFLRDLLQVGAAHESTELDELPDEVVLAGFHEHLQSVGRELRFRFDLVLLPAFDLLVEEHVGCTLAQAVAVDPNVFLQRLSDNAIAVHIQARVSCTWRRELFGFVGLFLASHIYGGASGEHEGGKGEDGDVVIEFHFEES